jgi:hypothetical protein
MDAKAINRAIKHVLWDCCRDHGFKTMTARAAWRRRELGVDVVDIQGSKWNTYDGEKPLGFYVNLGVSLDAIPPRVEEPPAVPAERPDHAACSFRWRLRPELPSGRDASLWTIAADGSDFVAVFDAIATAFEHRALMWFDRFGDLDDLLDAMTGPQHATFPGLFSMGADDSPARQRDVAYLALATERHAMAVTYFNKVLAYGPWKETSWLVTQLEDARERALAGEEASEKADTDY